MEIWELTPRAGGGRPLALAGRVYYNPNMKTIAITIEESALEQIDCLARRGRGKRRNRSKLIRQALQEYMDRLERQAQEEREREIYHRHHRMLNRQAAALIREQAKL